MEPPSAASLVLELLEVAIHSILAHRAVYPRALFEERRAFGVMVSMSRHPELNDYIERVLRSARPLLEAGAVAKLAVVISARDGTPVERWVFDLAHEARRLGGGGEGEGGGAERAGGGALRWDLAAVQDLEEQVRSLMLKLTTVALPPASQHAAFHILVYTDTAGEGGASGSSYSGSSVGGGDGGAVGMAEAAVSEHARNWVDVRGDDARFSEIADAQLTPVKSIRAGVALSSGGDFGGGCAPALSMEVYVERATPFPAPR